MNRGREDRDELAGAVAGSDRGMGPLGPGQRWTAARKREVVLRLLRGESLDGLSRELGVEVYRLEKWREKALGPDHPHVATSLNNLEELYEAQGQYAKAEPLHKRTLAIREKALGPDHPDVAQSLNNLALLYHQQGRYAKAEPLYERALGIMEKTVPNHPNVTSLLENLAELYTKTGRDDEAKGLLDRAERILAGQ